jgi:predicted amidophosphoribosyltransferase
MKKLLYIDELVIDDHYFLSEGDECYYFVEYTSQKGFNFSDGNNVISNLKKKLTFKGKPAWKYKQEAIQQVATLIKTQIFDKVDISNVTLVPIPPSKSKDHELYDDRMLQVLQLAAKGVEADIRELILCDESMEAAHEREVRPTIAELQENMYLDDDLLDDLEDTIWLFDDVLTTGAHFIACKNLILEHNPNASVYGIFVARRVIEKLDAADDFDDDWEI